MNDANKYIYEYGVEILGKKVESGNNFQNHGVVSLSDSKRDGFAAAT